MNDDSSFIDIINNMKLTHKLAAILFIMGKFMSILAGGAIFFNRVLAFWSLIGACVLIVSCIFVCAYEMLRSHYNVNNRIERLERELADLKQYRVG